MNNVLDNNRRQQQSTIIIIISLFVRKWSRFPTMDNLHTAFNSSIKISIFIFVVIAGNILYSETTPNKGMLYEFE